MVLSRVACLWVADFPLEAILRAEPDLRGTAACVLDGALDGPRVKVAAVTPEARAEGVRVGMTLAQARAAADGLVVRAPSAEAERSAESALGEVAAAFSPLVERPADVAGVALCEVGDLGRLFASERELATAMWSHATRIGLEARVAIARSPAIARVVAAARPGVTVVPPGQERAYLGPLPVAALAAARAHICDEASAFAVAHERLARFGVATQGALARLPRRSLVPRLGAIALPIHRIASGEDDSALCPTPAPQVVEEALDLDEPIDNLEALAFVLRGLVDRLVVRLAMRGLAVPSLGLRLALDTRGWDEREVRPAAPTREVGTLLELLRLALSERPPAAPVRAVVVRASPGRARAAQLSLWSRRGPSPEKLAATLARLALLCDEQQGERRVGRPEVLDAHLPDAFGVGEMNGASTSTSTEKEKEKEKEKLVPHCMRPPRAVEVMLRGGVPCSLRGEGLLAQVIELGGPYRVQVGFEAPVVRDYYDAELSSGVVVRLFHDLRSNHWFVDARYE